MPHASISNIVLVSHSGPYPTTFNVSGKPDAACRGCWIRHYSAIALTLARFFKLLSLALSQGVGLVVSPAPCIRGGQLRGGPLAPRSSLSSSFPASCFTVIKTFSPHCSSGACSQPAEQYKKSRREARQSCRAAGSGWKTFVRVPATHLPNTPVSQRLSAQAAD